MTPSSLNSYLTAPALKLLLIFTSLTSASSFASERSFFAFPAASSLHGVGVVYGVGAGVKNLYQSRINFVAGKSFGDVEAAGFLATNLPLGSKRWALNFGVADLESAEFDTSYSRHFEKGDFVRQKISGGGYFVSVDSFWLRRRLKANLMVGESTVKFEGFEHDDGTEIPLPNAALFDVVTSLVGLNFNWSDVDSTSYPTSGYRLALSTTLASGRTATSDTLLIKYKGVKYTPILRSLTWVLGFEGNDASVTKQAKNYLDETTVRDTLAADCESLSGTERTRCNTLEGQLANYIARQNRYGTAAPFGGSQGLRSFRQFRFRSAHNAILSTEFRWSLSESFRLPYFNTKERHLVLVPFADIGYAHDTHSKLFKATRQSLGLSLRAHLGENVLRLTGADGEEGAALFFTFGSAF